MDITELIPPNAGSDPKNPDEVNNQLSEINEAYSEYLHQIALVHRAIMNINSTLDPHDISKKLFITMKSFLSYRQASLWRTTNDMRALALKEIDSPYSSELVGQEVLIPRYVNENIGTLTELFANKSPEVSTFMEDILQVTGFEYGDFIPLIAVNRLIGVFVLTQKEGEIIPYTSSKFEPLRLFLNQAAILLHFAEICEELETAKGEIELLTVTDHLTGLHNRRYLEDRAKEEMNRAIRYGLPLTFLMIDIDHFKNINDSLGHKNGDRVLEQVAGIFQSNLRQVDIVARYGGEEFLIILPSTPIDGGMIVAERIRKIVETHSFKTDSKDISVTISIGAASLQDTSAENEDELINFADKALYEAKNTGRNKSVKYPF